MKQYVHSLILIGIILTCSLQTSFESPLDVNVPPTRAIEGIHSGINHIEAKNYKGQLNITAGNGISLILNNGTTAPEMIISSIGSGGLQKIQGSNLGTSGIGLFQGNFNASMLQFYKLISANSNCMISSNSTNIIINCNGSTPIINALNFTSLGNATGTTSLIPVMLGNYVTITPQSTGKVEVTVSGYAEDSILGDGCRIQVQESTSNMGTNGVVLSGSPLGLNQKLTSGTAAGSLGFSKSVQMSGISLNVKHYFDLSFAAIGGGTCTINNLDWSVKEIS